MCFWICWSVWRKPLPVMLRQMGKSSAINSWHWRPIASESGASESGSLFQFGNALKLKISLASKIRIALVALVNDALGRRPGDSERGIVPTHASRMIGSISIRHLVVHLCIVLERLKTVGKAPRNVKHFAILGR